ncbi:acetyltransferase [Sphingosinicella rhizophila]|uniref:Acetyltransferase n=1 Tax=Sphingosinicella rhizophila TaxID=3050082 RepID=A0ABU3Q7E3_9SPHN|nr:acetyltransferase [Sphingosinicella sp. GR2756]MDT9598903.1 acetyltransferase [Sphingosinicella sp. GR2756]
MAMIRILGAGGHAKVALEALHSAGGDAITFHDDDETRRGEILLGVQVAGPLLEAMDTDDLLHIAIGDNEARRRLAEEMEDIRFPPIFHAASVISPSAAISGGVLVCAGAIVQADARIGRHAIVNSRALVEHDVHVGNFAHIAPGVLLGGGVRIGDGVLVGIGATVMPNISIGAGTVIGAGSLVTRDVEPGSVMAGVPARSFSRGERL